MKLPKSNFIYVNVAGALVCCVTYFGLTHYVNSQNAEKSRSQTKSEIPLSAQARAACGTYMPMAVTDGRSHHVYLVRMDGSVLGAEIACVNRDGIVVKTTTTDGAMYPIPR